MFFLSLSLSLSIALSLSISIFFLFLFLSSKQFLSNTPKLKLTMAATRLYRPSSLLKTSLSGRSTRDRKHYVAQETQYVIVTRLTTKVHSVRISPDHHPAKARHIDCCNMSAKQLLSPSFPKITNQADLEFIWETQRQKNIDMQHASLRLFPGNPSEIWSTLTLRRMGSGALPSVSLDGWQVLLTHPIIQKQELLVARVQVY